MTNIKRMDEESKDLISLRATKRADIIIVRTLQFVRPV